MSNVFQNLQLQRIANSIEDGAVTVNIDVTGAGDMQPATATAAGSHGLVPAPQAGDENKVLSGAGTWIDAGGGELEELKDVTITSPTSGESLKYDGSKWVNGNVTADLTNFIEETSGSIVTVEAAERPAKSLVVAINPVQSGSGDPSPDNIRPISGWSACNVVVSPTQNAEDGTTYTIEFKDGDNPLTVYGGTLDVTNGTLTVDRVMVDLGKLNWFYNQAGFFAADIADMESKYNYASDVTDIIMSIAKYKGAGVGWARMANGDFGVNANAIRLKLTDYTTTASLVEAITGQTMVYPLATPTTYQLTPTVVQMLFGTNNIWADTGEITELKYIPQTYNDLLQEVGVTYKNRASVDTGEIWIDGNPIKVFTLYYNGLSGSSNRILLSDFGFTDTINSIVDIKTVYKNNVNGETHSQGAYCYSWYIGGWINTYINMDGTIYIRFYYT